MNNKKYFLTWKMYFFFLKKATFILKMKFKSYLQSVCAWLQVNTEYLLHSFCLSIEVSPASGRTLIKVAVLTDLLLLDFRLW